MSECPGCGKEMDHPSGDPMRTLRSITVHELFCAPPTFIDALLLESGGVSGALGVWVGRSIEKMVRALA